MALPKKLKLMDLFNEGNSYLGQTGEVTLPKLGRKFEDWRGGGMNGNIKWDNGLSDDMIEFAWKLGGIDPLVISQFGAATVGAIQAGTVRQQAVARPLDDAAQLRYH